MKLTPLDIRKQEFTRVFRGFEVQEVMAFLQLVAGDWEELVSEQRRQEDRIRELESKLRHYEQVEVALQQALSAAHESAEKLVEGAQHKAEGLVHEAKSEAAMIRREAEEERRRMRDDVMHLKSRRDQILARLRAFLASERELLETYEKEEAIRFGNGKMDRPNGTQVNGGFYQPRLSSHFEKSVYTPVPDPIDDEDADDDQGPEWLSAPRAIVEEIVEEKAVSAREAEPDYAEEAFQDAAVSDAVEYRGPVAWKQKPIIQAGLDSSAERLDQLSSDDDLDRIRRAFRNLD